ncbi:uncharacterized protein LOC107262866 [Cephus cinctus]|uniref:Uncharacterized protein LOC107262866 n=1 Tax=Cephus cinctus TaxID=211228 RepID=A0AAJ7BFR3_CEPCN|nr:uncharacterized protein LOC107262866 [Cephus cinctus]
MKNGFLQKKYSECVKKNKKYDGLEKVIDSGIRNRESYEEILEEYMEIKVDVEKRKPGYETEISKMEEAYKNQENEFNMKFKELLSRESEIGNNVINSKTGKAFGEREVNSMIERQKSRASELADTRFTYLKRRNILNHLLSKLYELDNLGIGYTTIEYEQMVIERQGVLEKLDEREEEIRKIRDKCFTYVAVLSHIKESIASIARDIQETSVLLSKYSEIQNYGRYATMKRKLERDITRKHNIQLRESGGLLAHPDLLSKMETDILQLQFFKEKIECLQAEVYLQHTQADMIKAFLKRQRNHSQSPLGSY